MRSKWSRDDCLNRVADKVAGGLTEESKEEVTCPLCGESDSQQPWIRECQTKSHKETQG